MKTCERLLWVLLAMVSLLAGISVPVSKQPPLELVWVYTTGPGPDYVIRSCTMTPDGAVGATLTRKRYGHIRGGR